LTETKLSKLVVVAEDLLQPFCFAGRATSFNLWSWAVFILQDKAKPRPFHVVDRVLRLELGAAAEEVFAEFSAEATAAASLAQVSMSAGPGH
jgi:hypothetical protein